MLRYIKTNTIINTITISILVVVEEFTSIAADRNIRRSVNKNIPKNFSKMEYDDFIGRVIAIIEDEYGFRLVKPDTSDANSLSYYYTFIKQDDSDNTIKLVLGCRVSEHDENSSPEAIKRRKGFEKNKALKLRSVGDSKVKYDFISVNVDDKRFSNYKEAAEHVRYLMDNQVVFVDIK